jgi:ATP-dependent Lon protease
MIIWTRIRTYSSLINSGNVNVILNEAPESLNKLLCIPINRRPVFPGFYKSVSISGASTIETISSQFKGGNPFIGIFLTKSQSKNSLIENKESIFSVGTLSKIINIIPGVGEGATAIVFPQKRIKILEILDFSDKEFIYSQVELLRDEPYSEKSNLINALVQEILSVLTEITKINPFFKDHISYYNISLSNFEDPSRLADLIAVLCSGESSELQELLESVVIEEKLRKALILLKKEQVIAQIQNSINKDVEQKLSQKQKEYFLMEQLKVIKKELGLDYDTKDRIIQSLLARSSKLSMPSEVKSIFEEELNKIQILETSSSEFNICRTYLEWLVSIPWGLNYSFELTLPQASEILDSEHFGMKKVKDRILEFISVTKLKGSSTGRIICLIGPPGVGKTSIAKSIAKALGRKYFRFSVGGLTDVAEIKGHRRTYIGSFPGKIIQSLKITNSMNPLIVIDEIDKINKNLHGDPSSALLELFDSEQNRNFLDYYIDIPTDVHDIIFICTANSIDTIPSALIDRMEIIEVNGYVAEEKIEIAKKYFVPQITEDCGLKKVGLNFPEESLRFIIDFYSRESGVRNLKRNLEAIFRKISRNKVEDIKFPLTMSVEQVKKFLGPPVYFEDTKDENLNVGTCNGLAWTPFGGVVITVESRFIKDSEANLVITGHLGKIMEESIKIAVTYVKSCFAKQKDLHRGTLHLHVPEGSIHKDGPSAGIAIASCLFSLVLNKKISSEIAMTGEITLTGRILKIGGIKEKIIAAKRNNKKIIILPQQNFSEIDELDGYIKEGLVFKYVSDYSEVKDICFR